MNIDTFENILNRLVGDYTQNAPQAEFLVLVYYMDNAPGTEKDTHDRADIQEIRYHTRQYLEEQVSGKFDFLYKHLLERDETPVTAHDVLACKPYVFVNDVRYDLVWMDTTSLGARYAIRAAKARHGKVIQLDDLYVVTLQWQKLTEVTVCNLMEYVTATMS